MKILPLLLLPFLLWQCKPAAITTKTNEPAAPQLNWTESEWAIINIFDEANKREYSTAAAPYRLYLDKEQWQLKLDKNTCNTTYSLSDDQNEMTVGGLGCTRICCDGDAGKALALAMATEQTFRIEDASTRDGWVLLKSPKTTLRLRPVSPDSTRLKPSEKVPQTIVGTWFAVHATQGGKALHKYPPQTHPVSFYDNSISVKLDVNNCSSQARYTENKIFCTNGSSMRCTEVCCDKVEGLTIFMGEIAYKLKDNFLILTTSTGYQLWLQR